MGRIWDIVAHKFLNVSKKFLETSLLQVLKNTSLHDYVY